MKKPTLYMKISKKTHPAICADKGADLLYMCEMRFYKSLEHLKADITRRYAQRRYSTPLFQEVAQ